MQHVCNTLHQTTLDRHVHVHHLEHVDLVTDMIALLGDSALQLPVQHLTMGASLLPYVELRMNFVDDSHTSSPGSPL